MKSLLTSLVLTVPLSIGCSAVIEHKKNTNASKTKPCEVVSIEKLMKNECENCVNGHVIDREFEFIFVDNTSIRF